MFRVEDRGLRVEGKEWRVKGLRVKAWGSRFEV